MFLNVYMICYIVLLICDYDVMQCGTSLINHLEKKRTRDNAILNFK